MKELSIEEKARRYDEAIERVQPQPKQGWSEEDENMVNRLIAYFEDKESFTAEDDIVYANWLKSLKDRYTWKPNNGQMKAIEHICDGDYNVDLDILDSIYRDFKKLREE